MVTYLLSEIFFYASRVPSTLGYSRPDYAADSVDVIRIRIIPPRIYVQIYNSCEPKPFPHPNFAPPPNSIGGMKYRSFV